MRKYLLALIILLLTTLVVSNVGSQDEKQPDLSIITKTASSDTSCINGVCYATIYPGIMNVFEDNTWKKIEEARSLKESGIDVRFLEVDPDYKIEVVDYNYTSITLNLGVSDKQINKDVPVKIWEPNVNKTPNELTGDFKQDYIIKEENVKNFKDKDLQTTTFDFGFGKILEFGTNSTRIEISNYSTGIKYGDFSAGGNSSYVNYLKFNISSVPSYSTIINANISMFRQGTSGTISNTANLTRVNNQTWEHDFDNNTILYLPLTNESIVAVVIIATSTYKYNVSDIIGEDVNLGNTFTSIRLALLQANPSVDPLTQGGFPPITLGTDTTYREFSNVSLEIDYLAETTPPTINLEAPADNTTNTTTNTIDFTYNVSDSSALDNCTLIIQNTDLTVTINATDTTMTKDTAGQNLTVYLDNGNYNWSVNCTDNINNMGASEIRNITINVGAANTCTYTSGSWNVNCADNCNIATNVDLQGQGLYFTGAGTFTLLDNVRIDNAKNFMPSSGCTVILDKGASIW